MLLAIDVGNTNTTLGIFDGEALRSTARLASDMHRTGDQYAIELRDVLALNGLDSALVTDAIICSVVPPLSDALQRAVQKLCGVTPLVLGPGVRTGLNIKIDNPAQLGADLAAGAVGALARYPLPCIVIDLGTASTISVLDAQGRFLGGVIAAGINLTLEALVGNTAQLPSVRIEAPPAAIGRNSVDSMKSGIVLGSASMLDGMIDRIEEELGQSAAVVATGGLAGTVVPHCRRKIEINDTLLLDGLRLIYEKNQ